MKHVTLISLFLFVTSCGNPHVSSVRNNIDRVVSPLTEEECAEATAEARVHTSQEQYQSVAQCQEQSQQEQEQVIEEATNAVTYRFAEPVSQFQTEVEKAMTVEAYDCNGSLMVNETLSEVTTFVGVTGPEKSICAVSLNF